MTSPWDCDCTLGGEMAFARKIVGLDTGTGDELSSGMNSWCDPDSNFELDDSGTRNIQSSTRLTHGVDVIDRNGAISHSPDLLMARSSLSITTRGRQRNQNWKCPIAESVLVTYGNKITSYSDRKFEFWLHRKTKNELQKCHYYSNVTQLDWKSSQVNWYHGNHPDDQYSREAKWSPWTHRACTSISLSPKLVLIRLTEILVLAGSPPLCHTSKTVWKREVSQAADLWLVILRKK